jgi:hypothetical protein
MPSFNIDFLEAYDDDSVLAELKRIASRVGRETVTKADINSIGRVSYSLIQKRFGSLRKALQLAGLTPQRFMNGTDDELLEIVVQLWEQVLEKEGRVPRSKDLKPYGFPVSSDTYTRRFGSWRKALVRAAQSVDADNVDEPAMPAAPVDVRKRGELTIRKRFFVMKRDSFACVLCGASGYGVRLEIDHKLPFSKGGRMISRTFKRSVSTAIAGNGIAWNRMGNRARQMRPDLSARPLHLSFTSHPAR